MATITTELGLKWELVMRTASVDIIKLLSAGIFIHVLRMHCSVQSCLVAGQENL